MSQQENLTINQGSDYTFRARLLHRVPDGCTTDCSTIPMDLSGKGVRAQIRRTYDACEAYDFQCSITDSDNGQITLFLPATLTATMKAVSHVWDVEIYDLSDTSRVFRPFYGSVTVNPEVTK